VCDVGVAPVAVAVGAMGDEIAKLRAQLAAEKAKVRCMGLGEG
jgi:hypothetical protein